MGRKFKKSLTIHQKLNLYAFGLIAVFSVLVVYLIISMISIGNSYNQVVLNITRANAYNLEFKREVDSSVYRMIADVMDAEEIGTVKGVGNPYETIEEARRVFFNQKDITRGKGNKIRIEMLLRVFDFLERKLDEVNESVKISGNYDKNIERWRINICGSTQLLQDEIQKYIYYEVASLEEVREQLEARENQLANISLLAFAVVILAAAIVSALISRSIAIPIQNLCRISELVARGHFDTRAEEAEGDELSMLTASFNSMVVQIGELIENIKLEQLNLRETELKLLQSQINPHFLYNTLDTIVWLAEGKQSEQVISMVSSLSHFFRTVLSEGRDFITIREEESHIRSYLEIQKVRYREILDYEIQISQEIYEYSILKLTLQPLIENAIYHGIKNKRGKGLISITGKMTDNGIEFVVKDNGIGMTEDALKELRSKIRKNNKNTLSTGGFGLCNVEERLKLNYGSSYGLTIKSKYGEGTEMMVRIPAKMER